MKNSSNEIAKHLNTEFIGRNIYIYEETDSTNNRAKENNTKPDGTVFIADSQTNGKGSRGRSWVSEKGDGIWLSILLKPDISPLEVSQITLVAGLAVCNAVGYGAEIKWPNDIVIGGRKLCGILTEMTAIGGKVSYVVCGIGINVNTKHFDGEITHRATSLFLESGQERDRIALTAKLLNEFEYWYKHFLDGGLESIIDEYRKHCVTLGRQVNVIYDGKTVTGTAIDVNTSGQLVVETDGGTVEVTSGEVSVRGIYGYV